MLSVLTPKHKILILKRGFKLHFRTGVPKVFSMESQHSKVLTDDGPNTKQFNSLKILIK